MSTNKSAKQERKRYARINNQGLLNASKISTLIFTVATAWGDACLERATTASAVKENIMSTNKKDRNKTTS